jgi:hypothetical protein
VPPFSRYFTSFLEGSTGWYLNISVGFSPFLMILGSILIYYDVVPRGRRDDGLPLRRSEDMSHSFPKGGIEADFII